MTVASRCLAVLMASLALPALASAPTDEQVRRLQQILGFDEAMAGVLEDEVGVNEALPALSEAQRACLLDELRPIVRQKLDGAFKQLFESDQNADAWLAFADTPGGQKMMSFVRDGVVAKAEQRPTPSVEQAFEGMPAEELVEVVSFMSSPAAKVLERDFPDVDMDGADMEVFIASVTGTCGINDVTP